MNLQPKYRANIPLVEESVRPFWSVMIPVYNCSKYLAKTLESVLMQAPGEEQMQIEVVDDFSSDNPEKVVWEVGHGRVNYFRQSQNLGHTKNFETCLKRSNGLWVHQLHGDDYILPGFYDELHEVIQNNQKIGAAFCQNFSINENDQFIGLSSLIQTEAGVIPDFLSTIAYRQRIFTPSIVVKRAVYEDLGGFDERLKWCEDWEMWVRISKYYEFGYVPKALACYRVHNTSNTARYAKNAIKMLDFVEGIKMVNNYLPEEAKSSHLKEVLNYYGETWVMYEIENALNAGDKKTAWFNWKLANSITSAMSVKIRLAKLAYRIAKT
ncbi:glycosyltransferase family 2 protein [Adhaeribacter radiodurans]|uniref:Glycosyltransferase n=1 Tax=Adhaeribacter radiodurans TaxID=2745197 RepID=A0A7L7L470_9BACT|nr:glycosyltransferase [Adhaeribacter radiodurans]QMU27564.1 glycosyltransferase [Adhaeribacter radiodurans]